MAAKTNASAPHPRLSAEDRKWKARAALEDIVRAESHRSDNRLMAEVKKLAEEIAKAATKATKTIK